MNRQNQKLILHGMTKAVSVIEIAAKQSSSTKGTTND